MMRLRTLVLWFVPAVVFLGLASVATGSEVSAGHSISRDLETLCSREFAGRGLGSEGLAEAADYLEGRLKEIGVTPAFDGSYRQRFTAPTGETAVNLVGSIGQRSGKGYVILGAHYDHLGVNDKGEIYYGADDNASGVATVLEAARILADDPPEGQVLLILFSGEEEGLLGSKHYADHPVLPLCECTAMVNVDTVGRLAEGGLFIFGADMAAEWKSILEGVDHGFHLEPQFPPKDPGGSDQKSFVEKGVAAIQLFTGAHADYHRPSDTLDKIDREGIARIAAFTAELCLFLAEEDQPLTFIPPGAENVPAPPPGGKQRRVSVGTIPDFEHVGEGILVSGIIPGSPAEQAGLQKGDLLLELDGTPLDDLAAYAAVLKEHAPGDEVQLHYRRQGKDLTVKITLAARK